MPDPQHRDILDSTPDLPLCMQPWWLDRVAGDHWASCVHRDAAGQVDGLHTYCLARRKGFRLIHPAPLSPYSGYWFRYPDGGEMKAHKQLAFRQEMLLSLLEQLPPAEIVIQQLQVAQTEILPLLWKGWQQQLKFTFRLDNPIDPDTLFPQMRSSLRQQMRAAAGQVRVAEEMEVGDALGLFADTLQRKSASTGLSAEALGSLIREASDRGQGRLLGAREESGRLQSAIFVAWDRHTMYYLLSGTTGQARVKGANGLLICEAIREASQRKLHFDFEGGMSAGIGQFFAAFGASPQPYLAINRCSNRFWALIGQWRYGL